MKILKLGDEEFRMVLTPMEARTFINCMNETIREIRSSEYSTRMGATTEQIRTVIASIEAALQ